jgi:NAD(P)-dependent dehydrogenase (short-subunit alcohol dehydrogenase family)
MSLKPLALVVGGSRGIGKSTALRLADFGFDICLTHHRNEKTAHSVCSEIESKGVA